MEENKGNFVFNKNTKKIYDYNNLILKYNNYIALYL